jgi:hypothetical protein
MSNDGTLDGSEVGCEDEGKEGTAGTTEVG